MNVTGVRQRDDVVPGAWRDSTLVAEACAQMLVGHHLGRVLDAGGGEGFVTAYLMRHRVVDEAIVFDPDETLLAEVPAPIQTRRGRLEDLDSSHGEFSTLLSRQVLHYLDEPAAILRRAGGRLRPGGAIYVGQMVAPDPHTADWLGRVAGWASPTRHRVWTADQLLTTFTRAGLSLQRAAVMPQRVTLADLASASDPAGDPALYLTGDPASDEPLEKTIQTKLSVRGRRGTLSCQVYWLHALLRVSSG
jgi:SAM-dependent methyltransferase